MRWRSLIGFALVGFVATSQAAVLQAQGDTRPGIAVMPFDNGGSYGQSKEDFEALSVGMQQMLTTELAQNPALRVVDRSQIKSLLAEQDLGAAGRVDANTAAKVGKLVGAKYVVTGGFTDVYGDFRLDVRIVNVETSEIVKTIPVRDKRENLYNIVTKGAVELTKGVNLPALPRQAMEQRENRKVPTEAVTYYSRALLYADRGNKEKAAELSARRSPYFPSIPRPSRGCSRYRDAIA
jgi:curli biogenesis system outer membrane secretion channel CsgG